MITKIRKLMSCTFAVVLHCGWVYLHTCFMVLMINQLINEKRLTILLKIYIPIFYAQAYPMLNRILTLTWNSAWYQHVNTAALPSCHTVRKFSVYSASLATTVIPVPPLQHGNEVETGDRESPGADSHIKHNLHFWQWGHFKTAMNMEKP